MPNWNGDRDDAVSRRPRIRSRPAAGGGVRGRGVEILDTGGVDPAVVRRSLGDVALANTLFGGTRAVVLALQAVFAELPRHATLLDAGTGVGDIPARAREEAARVGITLETVGMDASETAAKESRARTGVTVCGDVRALPFSDKSVDVVTCSQLLHHFFDAEVPCLLRELDRVARVRVIVSDLHRARVAAATIWASSFILGFHPVSRHDGVVSVMRGFTPDELADAVQSATGRTPVVHRRLGYRVTASWTPAPTAR
jgi:SAM-dependent methyltransferase